MTANFNGYSAREYFWGCKFSEKEPVVTWSFEEEDEDEDFLSHTLYLKQVSLGVDAPTNETHILQVETQDYEGNEKKIAIANLNSTTTPMANLDLSFDHKSIVTFRLVSGKGPVDLAATHLVEFPEDSPGDLTEEEESGDDETEDAVEEKNGKALKRKASAALNGKKAKKGKREEDEDDEEEDSEDDLDDDDDEDMDDEESDELESSPEVKRGKGKKTAAPKKPAQKAASADTKKAKSKPKPKSKAK